MVEIKDLEMEMSDSDGRQHVGLIPEDPWNEIVPGIWVGGSERGYPGGTFELVISVYDWHKDRKRWLPVEGTPHIVMPMMDANYIDEFKVHYLADSMEQFYRNGTNKILVRCQAGLNRSSLVVAAWFIKHRNMEAREAIQRIRAQRDGALFNQHFVEWLHDLERQCS